MSWWAADPSHQPDIRSIGNTQHAFIYICNPVDPQGPQVVAHYVAMTPDHRVFDSSLDKGRPYDFRLGSGQIVAGEYI